MTTRKKFLFFPILILAFTLIALPAMAELPDFTNLAKTAGSAVVNISTEKTVSGGSQGMQDFFQNRPRTPFDDFFKQFEEHFGNRGGPRAEKERSLGSGFIISPDGFIVTNNHVVEGADEIRINILDENGKFDSYIAQIVGTDPLTDLALLKIDAKEKLPTLEFADFDEVEVGQWVLAIGNPFGLDHTVTSGIVSALGRNLSNNPYDNFLQTDASINPGNSGGPLLNMEGKVIGINAAIIARGQGIGFAIPSSTAEDIINKLKTDKRIRRGWLGVSITNVDPAMAQALGLKEATGAFVAEVIPGQPAAEAGLMEGDIIVKVGDTPVNSAGELIRTVAELAPGSTTTFTLFRKDKQMTIKVKLGERAQATAQPGQPAPKGAESNIAALGLSMTPLTPEDARALGLKTVRGLLVTNVMEGGVAAKADLRNGDVVLEANLTPVNTVQEFTEILKTQGQERGALLLKIVRKQQIMFRTLTLQE